MKEGAAGWLVDWFKKKNKSKGIDIEASGNDNYFELGLIDSLEIVELIVGAEKEFGIKFTDKHFQDRRFATINGLAEIIGELSK